CLVFGFGYPRELAALIQLFRIEERFVTAFERINSAAGLIVPEIILLATMCLMYLVGPFLVNEAGKGSSGLRHRWGILSLLAIGCAIFSWWGMELQPHAAG